MERRFETQGETPVCKLELTPQQPPLTELKLSGESLYYAVLRATNGYTVMLREPPGTVKVPQGVYTVNAVWLKKGSAEAYRLADEPLLINATAPTNVVLGGPLTNSVTLTRQGRKLNMNYQLVGSGRRLLSPGAAGPRASRPSSRSITAARKFSRASSRLAEAAPARTAWRYPSRWRAN